MKTILILVFGLCQSVLAAGPGAPLISRQYSPLCMGSLQMWHCSSRLVTNSGAAISTWGDASGNGHVATASGNITNIANRQNAYPAVRFTNSSSAKFTFTDWNPNNTFYTMAVLKFHFLLQK